MGQTKINDLYSSLSRCIVCDNLLKIHEKSLTIKECTITPAHFKILRHPKGVVYKSIINNMTLFFYTSENRLSINNEHNTDNILFLSVNENKFFELIRNPNQINLLMTFS